MFLLAPSWGGFGTCAIKNEAPGSGSRLETKKSVVRVCEYPIFGARAARPGAAGCRRATQGCNDIIVRTPVDAFSGRRSLATDKELSDFLAAVDKRAFKRTVFHVRDDEAALDIVQDAMIRLAERYADRPVVEFAPLFQRILSNVTMDWFRRQKVRQGVMVNLSELGSDDVGDDFDLLEVLASNATQVEAVDTQYARAQILQSIEEAVGNLPARQREAFLLRYWEELDVAETAAVMGCSEGSVKTHCSRAVHALSAALKAKGIEP